MAKQSLRTTKMPDLGVMIRRFNRELIKEHGLPAGSTPSDPATFLLNLMNGIWPKDITDHFIANSPTDPMDKIVPWKVRKECAEILMRYVRPQIAAAEIAGPDENQNKGGNTINIFGDMLKLPGMNAQLERLSIEMSDLRRQKAIEARATLAIAPPTENLTDILDAEEDESDGTPPNERTNSDDPGEDGIGDETV